MNLPEQMHYDLSGLLPVVIQDERSLEVLILAYTNAEAFERTLETGIVHLWSRSRDKLWLKGESSGRLLCVREVRPNCEMNSLLVLVEQTLPGSCHTGHSSCFYRKLADGELTEIQNVEFEPDYVYGSVRMSEPLALLLGGYDWLARESAIEGSGTSRLLHTGTPDPWNRVRDEWRELLGVLDGTHRHTGFAEDALLEAYQVLYWTCLCQVSAGMGALTGLARDALEFGYQDAASAEEWLAQGVDSSVPAYRLVCLWKALGAVCRAAGIETDTVVQSDLDELREKPYMRPYFDALSAK